MKTKEFNECFNPEDINFKVMLGQELAWQITDGEVFSVRNMTEKEICESIVNDVLIATMWEDYAEQSIDFSYDVLTRFLNESDKLEVIRLIGYHEIVGLFEINHETEQIRIKKDKQVLQAAMDYSGLFFSGFNPSDPNEVIYKINKDAVKEMIDNIEPDSVLIDLRSTCYIPGNETVH